LFDFDEHHLSRKRWIVVDTQTHLASGNKCYLLRYIHIRDTNFGFSLAAPTTPICAFTNVESIYHPKYLISLQVVSGLQSKSIKVGKDLMVSFLQGTIE
jgi:hypothetical protein